MFLAVNAGKRSLAVSLSDERGRDAVLRLADGADVFLQSLRPGLAERLGLGAETLRAAQPAARLLHHRRLRPCRPAAGRARLRRVDAGGRRAHQHDGRARASRGARRLVPHRHGHRDVGGARASSRRCSNASTPATGPSSTRRSTRPRSGTSATTSSGYLADGTVPTGQGTVFPMVAPYQVFPTTRRRAHGRRRQRPAVRPPVRRARPPGARRRRAVPRRTPTASGTASELVELVAARLASTTPPTGRHD